MFKHNTYRILSILLAVVLLFGIFPPSALAVGDANTEQIQLCSGEYNCADNFSVRYFRTDGIVDWGCDSFDWHRDVPRKIVTAANSLEELEQANFHPSVAEPYSNAFFETHYLVIVSLVERSGSIGHRVDGIDENGNIFITRLIPQGGTPDMAEWDIVIELCRNFMPGQFYAFFAEEEKVTAGFFGNGGLPELQVFDVPVNMPLDEVLGLAQEPVREGYIFVEWGPLPTIQPVPTPMAFGAVWESVPIIYHTVTFIMQPNRQPVTIQVPYGTVLTGAHLPSAGPLYPGHTFIGWLPHNPVGHTVTADITFTQIWEPQIVPLLFIGNGGTPEQQEVQIPVGAPMDEWTSFAETPTREGYVFVRWEPSLLTVMPHRFLAVWESVVTTLDTTALTALVAEIAAMNFDEDDFAEARWTLLQSALYNAAVVLEYATEQALVDVAYEALAAALYALLYVPEPIDPGPDPLDTAALEAAIAAVRAMNEQGYTRASWAAVLAALHNAEVALDSAEVQALIDAAYNLLSAAVAALERFVNPFADVTPDDWFYAHVLFAARNEMMFGISDTEFAPGATMTRAQMVQVLYNAEGQPAVEFETIFSDVAAGAWYADAVIWAYQNGIVAGMGDGTFAPGANITREQMMVLLFQFAANGGIAATAAFELSQFTDYTLIHPWAQAAAEWAAGNGIVTGYNGALNPRGTATRAECAAILRNFIDRIVQ